MAHVVEIDSRTSIEDGVKALVSAGILSAPVYDAKNERYLGFFDLADALGVIRGVEVLRGVIPQSKIRNTYLDIHGIKLDLGQSVDGRAVDLPVSKVLIAGTQSAPWHPVKEDDDFRRVIELLAASPTPPFSPVRRVPIVGEDGRVIKVFSQSEMLTQIYRAVVRELEKTEPIFVQSFRTHRIGTRNVLSVRETQRAGIAFDMIVAHCISAVAVVDDAGCLTSCISNKDIGWLLKMRNEREANGGEGVDPMALPVGDFIKAARMLAAEEKRTRSEVSVVHPDMLIQDIIKTLAEHRTHRVFVVDEAQKPVGVVSVSDIVKLMLKEELPWPSAIIAKHMAGM